ncbi:MAG: B12-binding domain-containing radical SAM protein, partial [Lentisphaeria bacterium]
RHNFDSCENIPFSQLPAPDYSELLNNHYLNLVEQTNPMHRLWSNGRWNKMILAHGCYWAKCAFCDTSLDYIARYDKTSAKHIVDKIEHVINQTGQTGFHFVDEAAPPALLRQIAQEIIARGLTISYWTNIRFEKSFTVELATLMANSGCIAVSGGLEVASDRILKKINKGVTIETAATCMQNLSNANIMIHTYLMYGFPTQTLQETVNSLEVVRTLFENGLINSAFWHRYAMTIHSPSGINPTEFGIKQYQNNLNSFANNEIAFSDGQNLDYPKIGDALFLATYNYMRGVGFDLPLQNWFNIKIPNPQPAII